MIAARPLAVVERDVAVYRRMWLVFVAGLAEPWFYLLSIGLGVGRLVGEVAGPEGQRVPYARFLAPGLLAAAAMNGAIFEATYNFFFKFKYARTFNAMLATPLTPDDIAAGELAWALLRGTAHAAAFLGAMYALGLVASPWAVLAVPVAMLVGLAFGAVGMAATTWMRSFVDFDKVMLAVIPLFLFSGTFFPLWRYPGALRWVVQVTPLHQGVALARAVTIGPMHWALLWNAAYLLVMGIIGLRVTSRRLGALLQP